VVGRVSAVAYRKYKSSKGAYTSNAKTDKLDAEMETLIKKISEEKK